MAKMYRPIPRRAPKVLNSYIWVVRGSAYLKWSPIEKDKLRQLKKKNVIKISFKQYIATL